jgi:DNA-directed RNA polymerase specialized sigma subunit
MKAQEYLRQLEIIETRIRNIQCDIQQLKELALSITPSYEGERVQSSGSLQRTASTIDRWVDKELEMNSAIDSLVNLKLEIASTIEHLKKPKESGVLHMLYIQKKSFKEVAVAYDKSVSWATSVHGRALQSLQKELDARAAESEL